METVLNKFRVIGMGIEMPEALPNAPKEVLKEIFAEA